MTAETGKSKAYLELGLPEYLSESLEKFKIGERKYLSGGYYQFDCDFCELQSSINMAEVEDQISEECAWYLREHYLGITRSDIALQQTRC